MKWWLDMPSLTNVVLPEAFEYKDDVTIRGSTHFIPLSRIDIGALQRFFNWSPRGGWILFVPQIPFITVWESIVSVQILTQWPFQSQEKSIIQNRWNSRSSSFSNTIWNRYISHSIITCIPFVITGSALCFLHLLWYRLMCLFESHLKWLSWGFAVTIHSIGFHDYCDSVTALLWFVVTLHLSTVYSISSLISGSFSMSRSRCDDLVVIVMGRGYASFFTSSWVVMGRILVVCDNSTSSTMK